MSTAYQLYNRPDPLEDEPEPHSWDGEIARLWRKYGDRPFPGEEPMLGIKRKRWPHLDLIARYRCPGCGDVKEYTVNMRPGYGKDVYPHFYGRPSPLYCKCNTRMEYEGFVRRK